MVHCGGDIAAHCGASRSCDFVTRGTVVRRAALLTRLASIPREDLDVLGIANLLAGVDVDKDGHFDSLP
jgi:hypothetical protein